MKKLFLLLVIFYSHTVSGQIDKVVPAKPAASEGLVHDFAGILTDEQEQSLENKLVAYDDSSSNQIAIVTLPTLIDAKTGVQYEDEEVALKILREWGIGQKDRNNGIVILIVKNKDNTERKIRIEVGYGLEGAVPDVTAASIIDHEIAPNFKEGNYYRGLDEATQAIIKATAGEYQAPAGYSKRKGKGINFSTIIFVIVILIVIFSGAGGGGGGYVSRRGYRGWWLPTGGGGWSGGGGGGGWSGGGGGGFGGFGGGSGGGGGASGSW